MMMPCAPMPRLVPKRERKTGEVCPSSKVTRTSSVMLRPRPPYSAGIERPKRPSERISATISTGMPSSSATRCSLGTSRSRTKRRTVASSWSRVSESRAMMQQLTGALAHVANEGGLCEVTRMSEPTSPALPVRVERDGGIAVVTIDNPPVNALAQAVRIELLRVFRALKDDGAVRGIVLVGAGRDFVPGADIREMEAPLEPSLPEVILAMEACRQPIVAAISGNALGGGYELALACDRRLITVSATVGLPEVKLGIIPGGGGTQRLPRLVGVARAIGLIAAGRRVKARDAATLGMVDH